MEEVSIGEFAQRSRLSVKALRLYDELGVLVPAQLTKSRAIATTTSRSSKPHVLSRCSASSGCRWSRSRSCTRAIRLDAAEADRGTLAGGRDGTRHAPRPRRLPREPTERKAVRHVRSRYPRDTGADGVVPEAQRRRTGRVGARQGVKHDLRERPLPKMEGRKGAMFSIYWGDVSADSDGPVEWCKPIPAWTRRRLRRITRS